MVIRDGGWELLSYDARTGRQVWITYDDAGQPVTRTSYPIADIVKENHAFMMDSHGKPFGDWNRIASVPLNIAYEQLDAAVSQQDDRYLARWMNDSDNAVFRTSRGRV